MISENIIAHFEKFIKSLKVKCVEGSPRDPWGIVKSTEPKGTRG